MPPSHCGARSAGTCPSRATCTSAGATQSVWDSHCVPATWTELPHAPLEEATDMLPYGEEDGHAEGQEGKAPWW